MNGNLRFVLWGTGFGFVLSRAGATDFDLMSGMFRFTDLHLVGVIGGAVAVGAVGMRLAARLRSRTGRNVSLPRPRISTAGLAGAAVFGLGWGLTGACPGTALVQLGEGTWLAGFTVAGIFAGALAHAAVTAWLARRRTLRALEGVRELAADLPARAR